MASYTIRMRVLSYNVKVTHIYTYTMELSKQMLQSMIIQALFVNKVSNPRYSAHMFFYVYFCTDLLSCFNYLCSCYGSKDVFFATSGTIFIFLFLIVEEHAILLTFHV